jgi:hypothetical protein
MAALIVKRLTSCSALMPRRANNLDYSARHALRSKRSVPLQFHQPRHPLSIHFNLQTAVVDRDSRLGSAVSSRCANGGYHQKVGPKEHTPSVPLPHGHGFGKALILLSVGR